MCQEIQVPYGPRNKAIQTKRKMRLIIQELDQAVMWLDQDVIGQPVHKPTSKQKSGSSSCHVIIRQIMVLLSFHDMLKSHAKCLVMSFQNSSDYKANELPSYSLNITIVGLASYIPLKTYTHTHSHSHAAMKKL